MLREKTAAQSLLVLLLAMPLGRAPAASWHSLLHMRRSSRCRGSVAGRAAVVGACLDAAGYRHNTCSQHAPPGTQHPRPPPTTRPAPVHVYRLGQLVDLARPAGLALAALDRPDVGLAVQVAAHALVGVAKGAGKGGLQLGTRLLRRRLGAGLAFAHAAGVRREGSGSTRVGGRKAATAVGLWLLGSRGALHGTPHSASTLCLGCRGKDLLATDRDSHLVPSQLLPRCWWVYRCWNRFHTLEQRRFVERTPQNLKARAPLDTALVSYGDECAM